MGADRVEVAQQRDGPARVGVGQALEHVLGHQFGLAVGVGRHASRAILGDGHHRRLAIDGGRGAEHQLEHSGFGHGLAQCDAAADIGFVVAQRLAHAFANRLQAGEVHHRSDRVGSEERLEQRAIAHVALDEVQWPAGQLLHTVQSQLRAVAQVVQYQHLMPGQQQFEHRV